MSRYINADALISILNAKADMAMGTPKVVFFSVAKMVELLPTADVVEVVRCKECKHCLTDDNTMYCERATGLDQILPNDYCSYGVRREK
jgi:hypothetical protein